MTQTATQRWSDRWRTRQRLCGRCRKIQDRDSSSGCPCGQMEPEGYRPEWEPGTVHTTTCADCHDEMRGGAAQLQPPTLPAVRPREQPDWEKASAPCRQPTRLRYNDAGRKRQS